MSLALYRKYRSRSLDEVVGQDHVTGLLRRAIEKDKVAHAYLFTGPKGVGKTSIARILAHEINHLPYTEDSNHLDIVEIDAASNNGVEDIRDLRNRVQITPVSARKKVYIIDEVHMLSKAAFNALLKTLEEPPEHVVFILATTDIDKVPETILSRTQRHTFKRASGPDIVTNLRRIAKHEKLTVDDQALELIARHSDGSFRDSVSLFDQLVSGGEKGTVSVSDVTESLGLVSSDTVAQLLNATERGDIAQINSLLLDLERDGVPPRTTASQLADHLRAHITKNPSYIRLLEALLDINRSGHPELKLLTTLGMFVQPAQQAATLSPPVAKQSRTVERGVGKASGDESTQIREQAAQNKKPVTENKKPVKTTEEPMAFDWDGFTAHVKSNHVALYSVLSKCQSELVDGTLRLYTKSAFYKKKLDDTKYKVLLHDSLKELGYAYEVEILPTAKPLNDSQAARVAAIMGGGEEVDVD